MTAPQQTAAAAPATPLIGREQELALIAAYLQRDEVRLVTLVGPPGVGKTRLALQVMADHGGQFAAGAVFVGLESIRDAALVPAAIAQALGLREQGGRPLDAVLVDWLLPKRLLLVLDNFEQVLEAAALVSELLNSCPTLLLLVTSRAPLHLRAEQQLPIEPLPLPAAALVIGLGAADKPSLESIAASPAVALFLARAWAVQPSLTLQASTMSDIVTICTRLDGLPLALELAAARTKLLTPGEIVQQLEHRLAFLTHGYRDLPPRHQTLRAAIDWSYALLSPEEQRLFRLLGVFAAGGTLEAIAAVALSMTAATAPGVAAATPKSPLPAAVALLDQISALVDSSLVRPTADADGTSRFRMLETVREFALEQLAAAGEAVAADRWLATWFLTLAEFMQERWLTADEVVWLPRLDAEHDNLRAVLGWALQHDPTIGMRIGTGLSRYWLVRGLMSEGRRWLEQLLQQSAHAPAQVRARLLLKTGVLAQQQTDLEAAETYQGQALALFRELGDAVMTAEALSNLGIVFWLHSDFATATAHFEEGLVIAREYHQLPLVTRLLNNLGVLATDQGQLEVAHERFKQSLEAARAQGYLMGVATRLGNLAMIAIRMQDLPLARSYAEEALATDRELGNVNLLPNHLRRLAEILLGQGETQAAFDRATEALVAATEIGSGFEIAEAHDHLARVAIEQARPETALAHASASLRIASELDTMRQIWTALKRLGDISRSMNEPWRAVRLFAAAQAIRSRTGEASAAETEHSIDQYLTELTGSHGERTVRTVWDEGLALSNQEAIAYGLTSEPASQPLSPGPPDASVANSPGHTVPWPNGLSDREVEVLRLMASGASNRAIAERLVVSERTVEHHTTSIYRKIDVHSRVEAADYAHRHNLIN